MTVLLPPVVRTRSREEWLGQLHTLPARSNQARFAAHTLLGVPTAGRDPVQVSPW